MKQISKENYAKLSDTSFHSATFQSTVKTLTKVLGEPAYDNNDGEDKVNYEWEMETPDGIVFTVYDWKQYRPIKDTELIHWHIGTETPEKSLQVKIELMQLLK